MAFLVIVGLPSTGKTTYARSLRRPFLSFENYFCFDFSSKKYATVKEELKEDIQTLGIDILDGYLLSYDTKFMKLRHVLGKEVEIEIAFMHTSFYTILDLEMEKRRHEDFIFTKKDKMTHLVFYRRLVRRYLRFCDVLEDDFKITYFYRDENNKMHKSSYQNLYSGIIRD